RAANHEGRGSEAGWAPAAREPSAVVDPAASRHAAILARFRRPGSMVPLHAASRVVAELSAIVRWNRLLARDVFHAWRHGGRLRRRACPAGLWAVRAAPTCARTDVLGPDAGEARRHAACGRGRRGRILRT